MYYDSVMVEVPIGVEGGTLTTSYKWNGAYNDWQNAEAGKIGTCYVKTDMPLHLSEAHYDPDLSNKSRTIDINNKKCYNNFKD